MKIMVLAAGESRRLRPLTEEISKPMAPVVNRPVMEHIIRLLQIQGFVDLVANVHYCSQVITDYFGDGSKWGVNLRYSLEEKLLGTAGGVKKAEKFLGDAAFIVFSGDLLTDIDLLPLISFHKKKKALATLALTEVEDPSKYGVVVTARDGRIVAFQEKPSKEEALSNLVSCGIYVLEPEIFSYLPQDSFYDFGRNLFPLLREQKKRLYGFCHSHYWLDIGEIDTYRRGNFHALSGKVKLKIPGTEIKKGIWVGERTEIHKKAELIPPLCIGSDCVIKSGAKLIGPTVIGDGSFIEEDTLLKSTIKWGNGYLGKCAKVRGGIIGDSTYISGQTEILEESVIGASSVLGPGSVIHKDVILKSKTLVGPDSEVTDSI